MLSVGAAIVGAGVGWSLVNAGLLQWLYAAGTPTRVSWPLHDFALLGRGFCGALAAPLGSAALQLSVRARRGGGRHAQDAACQAGDLGARAASTPIS